MFLILMVIFASASTGNADAVNELKLLRCVGGSETGNKIAAAFATCFAVENNRDVNVNGEQCHDFATSVGWIHETFSHEICILKTMRWLNENMTYNSDQFFRDITNLPKEVSGALKRGKDEWKLCAHDKLRAWGEHECYSGTDSLYTEHEKVELAQIGEMVAQAQCFRDGLIEVCTVDDMNVLKQCVANSPTEDKIEDALKSCSESGYDGTQRSLTKRTSLRSDNQHQCIDYNTTVNWLRSYYAGEHCVLDHMGWFLNNGTTGFNVTTIIDDISGLPAGTDAGIWQKQTEGIECVDYFLGHWSKHPCWKGSDSLYTDEEREGIEQLAAMIAQYECVRHFFHQVCLELYGDNRGN